MEQRDDRGAAGEARLGLQVVVVASVLVALGLQLALFYGELHDQVTQTTDPAITDAVEYAERARELLTGKADLTLRTAFRMPGYPALLALIFSTGAGPLVVRLLQMALTATLPGWLAWAARRAGAGPLEVGATAVATSLFVPLYWFSPLLFAEAPSVVLLMGLILWWTGPRRFWWREAFGAASWIWAATLLKPNHLAFVVPATGALLLRVKPGARIPAVLLLWGALAGGVFPWTWAASLGKAHAVLTTTADGQNFWLGVGGAGTSDPRSLPARVSKAFDLHDPAWDNEVDRQVVAEPDYSERSAIYKRAAWAQAQDKPLGVLVYDLAKVGHVLGLSMRGIQDLFYAGFTGLCLAGSVVLWRRSSQLPPARPDELGDATKLRALVVGWGLTLAVCLGQAAVFLPNLRFRVVLLDPLGLLVVILAFGPLVARRLRQRT